jgi:hypothetical protein
MPLTGSVVLPGPQDRSAAREVDVADSVVWLVAGDAWRGVGVVAECGVCREVEVWWEVAEDVVVDGGAVGW